MGKRKAPQGSKSHTHKNLNFNTSITSGALKRKMPAKNKL
jgi:hypothetical protein